MTIDNSASPSFPHSLPVWWGEGMEKYAHGSFSQAATTVAIIGGGLAGILTAWYLASLGCKDVTLFEKRSGLCEGASGRNGGHVVPGTVEFDEIADRLDIDRAKELWLFEEHGVTGLTGLIKDLHIDCDFRETGHVSLAVDGEEFQRIVTLHGMLSDPKSGIPPVEIWGAEQCECATGSKAFVGGLYRPRSAQLNPVKLCLGLANAAVRLGVDIRVNTTVNKVEEQEQGGFKVVTDEGVLTSEYVVYATSAESIGTFVPELSGKIYGVQGQVIATKPVEQVFHVGCSTFSGTAFWLQTKEGRIVLGGMRSFAPGDGVGVTDETSVNDNVGRALRRFLQYELGLTDVEVEHEWTGIMGTSLDGYPFVGELPSRPGQYAIVAFAGHGLPVIPSAAKAVAQMITGEGTPNVPWLFHPKLERFTKSV